MAGVGGSGGVNGEANELNDYAAKTHELQTIIEKQVKIFCSEEPGLVYGF